MAQDLTDQEQLLRLLMGHEEKYGEKGGWLLIAMGLVYLGQLIQVIEKRAAVVGNVPAGKDLSAGTGKGLTDLLGALGPLMSSFKAPPPSPQRSASDAQTGTAQTDPAEPIQPAHLKEVALEEARRDELRPVKSNGVIKWDPRLVGGERK